MTTLAQYSLRDYQQELVEKIISQWGAGNRRLLMGLPTGAGKTVLFSAVAEQFIRRGEGVLILAHREELLLQAQEKLEAVVGQPTGLIKAGYPTNPERLIQVASIQSLIRRNFPAAGLVVVDEAHHSPANSYKKVFEHYSSAYILGVTATPHRPDGQGFRDIYDALIVGKSTKELIDAGYLCDFKIVASPKVIDTTGVKTVGGDFNQEQLIQAVNSSLLVGDLIESWRRFANGKKTIVFAVNVEHSMKIACGYLDAGIPAEHLDGSTPPDERRAILEKFRTGKILILSNCGIVSEGFDVPSIEAVQCVRPTKSLNLWLQIIGRSLRPFEGKTHAIIIDHSTNWIEHGLPDETREWTLEPKSMEHRSLAVECEKCHHIFRPLPHEKYNATCPNCSATVEINDVPRDETGAGQKAINHDKDVHLEEINLKADSEIIKEIMKIKMQQQMKGYKPIWVYYRLTEKFPNVGLGELRELAKLLGYSPGWAWHRWWELKVGREEAAKASS